MPCETGMHNNAVEDTYIKFTYTYVVHSVKPCSKMLLIGFIIRNFYVNFHEKIAHLSCK